MSLTCPLLRLKMQGLAHVNFHCQTSGLSIHSSHNHLNRHNNIHRRRKQVARVWDWVDCQHCRCNNNNIPPVPSTTTNNNSINQASNRQHHNSICSRK